MTVLLLYLSWTMRNLSLDDVQTEDAERERVESQRDAVLAIFQQHAVSNETNALEAIRRDVGSRHTQGLIRNLLNCEYILYSRSVIFCVCTCYSDP
jgi:hypothetical protein